MYDVLFHLLKTTDCCLDTILFCTCVSRLLDHHEHTLTRLILQDAIALIIQAIGGARAAKGTKTNDHDATVSGANIMLGT